MNLTPKEEQCFLLVKEHILASGYPPSLREIGAHMKISPIRVSQLLESLDEKGLIKRTKIIARGIKLTNEGISYAPL